MLAGGTKVEFGCEIASRGDLAACGAEGLVLEADLARREVRLRVGAMVGECCEVLVVFLVLIEDDD